MSLVGPALRFTARPVARARPASLSAIYWRADFRLILRRGIVAADSKAPVTPSASMVLRACASLQTAAVTLR